MSNFIDVETDLVAEERMISDTAREFSEETTKPDCMKHFSDNHYSIHTQIVCEALTDLPIFE